MAADYQSLTEHIKGIIKALGDDPEREGLKETPERAARMLLEAFEGINYSNAEIAAMFDKTFEDAFSCGANDDIIEVRDIEAFSYCEHHMALMYDMKISVAYIPNGRILGLSKIARIADMAARRLQLQERLCSDIAEIMAIASGSEDVAVFAEARHSCMTARGINKTAAKTYSSALRGRFKTDPNLYVRLKNMRE
jgi:GTP cyclohydrolase I